MAIYSVTHRLRDFHMRQSTDERSIGFYSTRRLGETNRWVVVEDARYFFTLSNNNIMTEVHPPFNIQCVTFETSNKDEMLQAICLTEPDDRSHIHFDMIPSRRLLSIDRDWDAIAASLFADTAKSDELNRKDNIVTCFRTLLRALPRMKFEKRNATGIIYAIVGNREDLCKDLAMDIVSALCEMSLVQHASPRVPYWGACLDILKKVMSAPDIDPQLYAGLGAAALKHEVSETENPEGYAALRTFVTTLCVAALHSVTPAFPDTTVDLIRAYAEDWFTCLTAENKVTYAELWTYSGPESPRGLELSWDMGMCPLEGKGKKWLWVACKGTRADIVRKLAKPLFNGFDNTFGQSFPESRSNGFVPDVDLMLGELVTVGNIDCITAFAKASEHVARVAIPIGSKPGLFYDGKDKVSSNIKTRALIGLFDGKPDVLEVVCEHFPSFTDLCDSIYTQAGKEKNADSILALQAHNFPISDEVFLRVQAFLKKCDKEETDENEQQKKRQRTA